MYVLNRIAWDWINSAEKAPQQSSVQYHIVEWVIVLARASPVHPSGSSSHYCPLAVSSWSAARDANRYSQLEYNAVIKATTYIRTYCPQRSLLDKGKYTWVDTHLPHSKTNDEQWPCWWDSHTRSVSTAQHVSAWGYDLKCQSWVTL